MSTADPHDLLLTEQIQCAIGLSNPHSMEGLATRSIASPVPIEGLLSITIKLHVFLHYCYTLLINAEHILLKCQI